MLKFRVSRSQVIDRPVREVFEIVRDFHQWPKWSRWLIADPECEVEIEGSGVLEEVGAKNLCDAREVMGVSCDEFKRDGAFSEWVVVPARNLERIPEELGF